MKNILILVFVLTSFFGFGQTITNNAKHYVFSSGTGSAINPTYTNLIASAQDDAVSSVTNIGFTFKYEGVNYTQFCVSSNGLMRLGGATLGTGTWTNNIADNTTYPNHKPKIMPWWDDLATGSTGSVAYGVSGSSPNRILVIRFRLRWSACVSGCAYNLDFHVRLYETSNKIEFYYVTGGTSSNTASCGIGGTTAGNFVSVTTGASPTASNSTAKNDNNIFPSTNALYTFTPCSPPAAFSISGETTPCVNSSQTYTAGAGSGSESWTFPSGWTITAGGTSASCTVTVGSTSGTISCTRTNTTGGCSITSSNTISATPVNGVPAQPSTITGNTSICSSVDNSYSVTNVSGVTYTWSYSGTGTLTGSGNSRTLNATTSGTLTCTPSNNCGNGTSRTLAITVNESAAITGTLTACSGSTSQLSGNGTPNAINPWTSANTSIATVSNTGLVTAVANSTTSTTITYLRSNGCSVTATFSINPVPSAPSNPVNYTGCAGSASMSVTSQFVGKIDWYTDSDLTNSVNNQTTTSNGQVVTYSPNLSSSQTYYVTRTITATGCRGPSTTVTATVYSTPTPTFTSSPGSNSCIGVNVTYTTQASQTNYVWSIPGTSGTDYTLVSGGNSTSNSTVISWLTTGSKTVTVNYNDGNGCTGTAASNTTTVNSNPSSAGFARTPNSAQYNGASVDFSTSPTGGTGPYTYSWTTNGTSSVYSTPSSGSTGTFNATWSNTSNSSSTLLYTMTVTDSKGCVVTQTMNPTIHPDITTPSGTTTRTQGVGTDTYTTSTTAPLVTTNINGYTDFVWSITPANAGTISSSGEVTWNSEFYGTATISVYARNANAVTVGTKSGTQPSATKSLSVTVEQNSALPVELISFVANCQGDLIDIEWSTASEYNSSNFTIEKSRDGLDWIPLEVVGASGFSNQRIDYKCTDKNSGVSYYRLIQTDFDGTYKTYGPVIANCESEGYINSFPNPSGSTFSLILNSKDLEGNSEMKIFNSSGNLIYSREILIKPGINMFEINSLNLSPGKYFIFIGNKTLKRIEHVIYFR